jgi:hypothetical protein
MFFINFKPVISKPGPKRAGQKSTSMEITKIQDNKQQSPEPQTDLSRRKFLQLAGGVTAAGVLIASCKKTPPDTIYMGKGDIALLNTLYLVEQLLSDFYTQANVTPYYGLSASELGLLADMRDHALAHRELLKNLLGSSAIPDIVTVLTPVTFADRTDFLSHASIFEDIAVGAYHGVGQRFSDTSYVLLTAKMATVQARHSSYVRDILNHNNFADSGIVNSKGLEQTLAPASVFAAIKPYLETKFDITNLPA